MMRAAGAQRVYEAVGAVFGVLALGLQLYLFAQAGTALGRTLPGIVVQFLSYFTILSNILVVLCYLGPRLGGFFARAGVRAAVAVYIFIVGAVYATVLAALWSPSGWQFVADAALHYAAPVLYVVYWLLFVDKASLRYGSVFVWIAFPLAYCAYALLRGWHSGLYPYPFLEADKLGYGQVAVNVAVLIAVFLVLSMAAVALGRWLQGVALRINRRAL